MDSSPPWRHLPAPYASAVTQVIGLGCSPATSTQMVSLVSRSGSIASRRTVQIGAPSRVTACRYLSLKSGRGLAAPHTRNWTPLVSIRSRMMLLLCLTGLSQLDRSLHYNWLRPVDVTGRLELAWARWYIGLSQPSMLASGRRHGGRERGEHGPMSHDQGAGRLPASKVIADTIREQIESGELPPGAKLPSERDLASTYGTARNTGREAIRILADAGLVITDHGRGSFVRPYTPLIRL